VRHTEQFIALSKRFPREIIHLQYLGKVRVTGKNTADSLVEVADANNAVLTEQCTE
jgi:hypothetical protein